MAKLHCGTLDCKHKMTAVATHFGIHRTGCTGSEFANAMAYDMSNIQKACDLKWLPMCADCITHWYEGGWRNSDDRTHDGYDPDQENTKWWKRPINYDYCIEVVDGQSFYVLECPVEELAYVYIISPDGFISRCVGYMEQDEEGVLSINPDNDEEEVPVAVITVG